MLFRRMMLGLFIAACSYCSFANAQMVTVDGVGTDKNNAVRDAMRNAVEEVIGSYINSKTLVSKAEVKVDEIMTSSQGFVNKVKIISEGQQGELYRVKCSVDVNDKPNSALMDKLNVIMQLNDPRIATVINCSTGIEDARLIWKKLAEGKINAELINRGFNHIVDAAKLVDGENIVQLPNAEVDYVVLGELHFATGEVVLPKFYVAGQKAEEVSDESAKTNLNKAVAVMNVRIVKADNQEVVSHFTVTETKFADTDSNAERIAIESLGVQTAKGVAEAFAKRAARVNNSRCIIARAESYDLVIKLQKVLSSLPCVESVLLRGYSEGTGTLDIVSNQDLNIIYRLLREQDKLGLYLENLSENILEISVN